MVIIPDECRNWTREQCSSALFHELSHVKRGDFLIKLIARISCSIFWFNPLGWLAFKMMKKEQEKACDELVLKCGVRPSTYAANLLSIKKSGLSHWNMPAAVLGVVGNSQLNERINAILKKQFKSKEIKMKTKLMISLTVILFIIVIGLARPSHTTAYDGKSDSHEEMLSNEVSQKLQEKNVQEDQEKKQEEKSKKKESKEKKDKKKEIKWISKDNESKRVAIFIDEGEKAYKINLAGKTLTIIKEDGTEKTITLKTDGIEFFVQKDDEGCWTIRGDSLEVIKGDDVKVIKIQKGDTIRIDSEDEKGRTKLIKVTSPKVLIHEDEKGHKSYTIQIISNEEGKKKVHIVPHVEVHPVVHLDSAHEKLKEKLKELHEKLQKIKEKEKSDVTIEAKDQTIEELEAILKELSEELEKNSSKLRHVSISLHTSPEIEIHQHLDEIKEIKDHVSILDIHQEDKVTAIITKDKTLQIVFKTELDSEHKKKYEEVIEKLKKKLAASYKVESEVNQEENTFIIKIIGEGKGEQQEKDLKNLIKKIVEEIKKVKNSKTEKSIYKI